jgi:haloacid dehalogenase superfamily, subfamily IA, variant 3 with third motif having DD or ED/beta-phosphoglucomutase family hydrolase
VGAVTEAIRVPYDAVIFDMDGIVTDTASVHARAWKELFDAVLAGRTHADGSPVAAFDENLDYRRYVDGRSREDGVVSFLAARGIELPRGELVDPPERETVRGLAARKNRFFEAAITRDGVRSFPSTTALIQRLRAGHIRTALVTASRNASGVLAAAGVDGLFDARVDGGDAAELDLPGKPDPALFLEAARRVGVAPDRAVVVEDATAGVEAGRRGRFGLVVGVDRGGHRADLLAAGADLVVADLGELDLGARSSGPWSLVYDGFDPAHEGHREALTTLGNGYLATRGSAPEMHDDGIHYPGTYMAGVFNRLKSVVDAHEIEDESLVNVPNWLPLDFRLGDAWLSSLAAAETARERRALDLRRGVLARTLDVEDEQGRRTHIEQRRVVSMARPHVAALQTTLVAENWSGPLRIRTGIDGGVVNDNVDEYRSLAKQHLLPIAREEAGPHTLLLEVETTQSHIRVAVAARSAVTSPAAATVRSIASVPSLDAVEGSVAHVFDTELRAGEPLVVEKVVGIVTSRDAAISSPRGAALDEVSRVDDFAALAAAHELAWRGLWDRFAVGIDADDGAALALDLHVFHLVQSLSPHTAHLDAGVPARGLHGEAYRGHVFWDELFVFPLLDLRLPALTRALLVYRWRRLDTARATARAAGLPGARFPWQSGSDGREETPAELFNPRSGRWMRDNSHLQHHVGLAVAYNVWHHYQVTGDVDFLTEYGAELMIEIARLFAGLAVYDADDDRYDIAGVMGPDEYHDAYPGASEPGLRNNAYTNVMAAWLLRRALDVVTLLSAHHCGDLWERLGLGDGELEHWEHASRRLRVRFHADGVISQFEGYEQLDEFDWDRYRAVYGNIGRLDLILESEGDTTNRYKVSKQADVLMLFYLLSVDELRELFERLGYALPPETVLQTVDYYLARTANGSTLSRVVHAWVLARADRSRSWSVCREALDADLDDTQGGTTREGIHLGAMAGTVDLVLRGYAGIEARDDALWFDPCLPDELRGIRFELLYRGQRLWVELDRARLRVHLHPCAAKPVRIGFAGELYTMAAGETHELTLEWTP